MLASFVNGGILLLVVVSLMRIIGGLVRGHRAKRPCIMRHVDGLFHDPRAGPARARAVRNWAGKHGLSVRGHSVQRMAGGWH